MGSKRATLFSSHRHFGAYSMPYVYVCEYSFKQTGALLDHFKQETIR